MTYWSAFLDSLIALCLVLLLAGLVLTQDEPGED